MLSSRCFLPKYRPLACRVGQARHAGTPATPCAGSADHESPPSTPGGHGMRGAMSTTLGADPAGCRRPAGRFPVSIGRRRRPPESPSRPLRKSQGTCNAVDRPRVLRYRPSRKLQSRDQLRHNLATTHPCSTGRSQRSPGRFSSPNRYSVLTHYGVPAISEEGVIRDPAPCKLTTRSRPTTRADPNTARKYPPFWSVSAGGVRRGELPRRD